MKKHFDIAKKPQLPPPHTPLVVTPSPPPETPPVAPTSTVKEKSTERPQSLFLTILLVAAILVAIWIAYYFMGRTG